MGNLIVDLETSLLYVIGYPANWVLASPIHGMAERALPTYSETVRFCLNTRPIVTETDEVCRG